MAISQTIWLASWPRSGNTYVRTILWQCFGLRSASIYTNDFGGNQKLEEYVGHVRNKESLFVKGQLPLVKTHGPQPDDSPAIYIVRNGKDAAISLWQYYKGEASLEQIIEGHLIFGTWTEHLQSWRPWERRNTLLLKYEDILNDLPGTLNKISGFLGVKILNETVPPRDDIANIDGRYVKKEG
ncbi:MAG: sulfotransferase domain-containing protein, partial [Gallionella sp.]